MFDQVVERRTCLGVPHPQCLHLLRPRHECVPDRYRLTLTLFKSVLGWQLTDLLLKLVELLVEGDSLCRYPLLACFILLALGGVAPGLDELASRVIIILCS